MLNSISFFSCFLTILAILLEFCGILYPKMISYNILSGEVWVGFNSICMSDLRFCETLNNSNSGTSKRSLKILLRI